MKSLIVTVISYGLAFMFFAASASTVIGFENFSMQLHQSPLFTKYARVISFIVPCLQVVIAVMLVFKHTMQAGLYAAFSLLLFYSYFNYYILHYVDDIPCACIGFPFKSSWEKQFIFNIAAAAIAILCALLKTVVWYGDKKYSLAKKQGLPKTWKRVGEQQTIKN